VTASAPALEGPRCFCRDCLADLDFATRRCSACGSPRLVRHHALPALTLAHIDCDAFYATVEKRDNPELADRQVIIGDIRLIQRLEDWSDSTAGGLQIYVKDVNRIDEDVKAIEESMDYDLYGEKVSDTYVQVFEWLGLVSRQVYILLGIILTVVCVNMISVVLILVMERTQMIGVLKALGATDRLIRSIFVYNGISLIVKGLVLGNVLGLGLCYVQYQFKFIKLNAHDYYMSYVPIHWDWQIVVILNVLVFVVVTLVLLLPTAIVSRITPMKAIRFD